jgi:hypothetical protein
MRSVLLGILIVSLARAATVSELMRTVRDAMTSKQTDGEIAALVKTTSLAERLENVAIEQLQFEGAGPRTVEELEWQREQSSRLPAPAALALSNAEPAPPPEEQTRLIERARAVALQYSANLPNFIATETVRRYLKDDGKPWKVRDTLEIDVAYSPDGERYKPLSVNGKPTKKKFGSLGGFISAGEFGSLLRFIYRPESAAKFRWERWGYVRGQRVAVLGFAIDRRHSNYTVSAVKNIFQRYRLVTGAVGLVYIDPESHRTLRFSDGDDGLPPDWPIQETWSVLDYDYAEVGGEKYLLPRRIDMRVVFQKSRGRNITEFANYRKFAAEATVTFEK